MTRRDDPTLLDDLFDPPADAPARERVVQVLTPVALDDSYTYKVPAGADVRPGSIVRVPLGPRQVLGVVTAEEPTLTATSNRLRSIETVFDAPPLREELLDFVDWVARYTLTPRGMVMRMVLRAPEALEPEAPLRGVARAGAAPDRMTPARHRVLQLMDENDGMAWTRTGLAATAGVSISVVDGLLAAGTLVDVELPAGPPIRAPEADFAPARLTADQARAATSLRERVGEGANVTLLDGVTGSGKTEVYLEAVAETVRQGRQALILVPEIALTKAFLQRFAERFGALPAEWHSDVGPKARARAWRGVAEGRVRVVVGARSALFLPFRELGLIVVDEEHDPAYKQEEWATYHARDMAVVRGRMENAPVVLASATPSLETRVNADRGRYAHLVLPARATGQALPEVAAIDMRKAGPPRGRFLAPGLLEAVRRTTERGEQALLFLNRRGYAPLTLCRSCGHRFQCPNCSAWLVEHRFRGRLTCHHCGHMEPRPEACPKCGALDSLVACGPGVERIAEEVQEVLPDRRAIVLSSDMAGGIQRLRAELEAVAKGECDVVIGTQLVAKGHTFPRLTLVGVVDADLGLSQGDPRAAERTFQLLAQVTGRAGRVAGTGLGILQTYAPESPVIRALVSGDPERFYATELEERQIAGMPPFGRLAAVVVSGPDRERAEDHARALARAAPSDPGVEVLGPADAPLSMVRGRHRFRLLAHAPRRDVDLSAYMRAWLSAAPKATGGIDVLVDIDPQSFL
ncbi:primosomal protein N' [Chthonobacter rhizosphaerae]|uniref:primosomal protein N' n=1 Tax=Chthonobacter rhizosphaerae TaxID=2735553 RepID=UPI0015EF22EE|nr:primosomal protein N' [Chthonobacter rhizosphaerae]